MRLPRVQFTVRRLMVAVAIAAICTWGERTRRASVAHGERMRRISVAHGNRAASYRNLLAMPPETPHFSRNSTEAERAAARSELASRLRRRNHYYEMMRIKYERAALYPWFPVAPDPPEP